VHELLAMVFASSVTAPDRASVRPTMLTPVVTVIDAMARMLPWKDEDVPSVAELPTCQKMLHALAPLMRLTTLAEAVMSVLSIWKTKTASGSFCALSVNVPVIPNVPAAES
jgi:hypothetical protein